MYQSLEMYAMNRKRSVDMLWRVCRQLRREMDNVANELAKERAEWMDDPEDKEYAKYHAPAFDQFSRATRDRAILGLVQHYLQEITCEEINELIRASH